MEANGRRIEPRDDGTYLVKSESTTPELRFTLDRDAARDQQGLDLLGLDHPIVLEAIRRWQDLPPARVGVAVEGAEGPGVMTYWLVDTLGSSGDHRVLVVPIGVNRDGRRSPELERCGTVLFTRPLSSTATLTLETRQLLLHDSIEPLLERELQHRAVVPTGGSYSAKLIGWAEVTGVESVEAPGS